MAGKPKRCPQVGEIIRAIVPGPRGEPRKERRLLVIKVPSFDPSKEFDAVALSASEPTLKQLDFCVPISRSAYPESKLTADVYIKCYWYCCMTIAEILDLPWGKFNDPVVVESVIETLVELSAVGPQPQLYTGTPIQFDPPT